MQGSRQHERSPEKAGVGGPDPTVAGCSLAVSAPSSGKANSHGVTGGVYKARERIHRSVLICDY